MTLGKRLLTSAWWLIPFALGMLLLGSCREPGLAPRVDTVLVRDTIVRDSIVVDSVPVLRVDTLTITHVDTVPHYDTVTQTITVVGPPVHDSVIVARVDTVLRVDTVTQLITLPGAVVHDTTWLYTQTNPTNPFAGGDPASGLLVLRVWTSYYLVFWHAHFMGVLTQGGTEATPSWYAFAIPTDGSMLMPVACTKPTWQEAAACLEPLVLTLVPTPIRLEASPALVLSLRVLRSRR